MRLVGSFELMQKYSETQMTNSTKIPKMHTMMITAESSAWRREPYCETAAAAVPRGKDPLRANVAGELTFAVLFGRCLESAGLACEADIRPGFTVLIGIPLFFRFCAIRHRAYTPARHIPKARRKSAPKTGNKRSGPSGRTAQQSRARTR